MMVPQYHYGYLTVAAVDEATSPLGMSPPEIDEPAKFYTFLFLQPLGKYVIHVCGSVVRRLAG